MSTPTAFSFGTGRRKTAVARVRLLPGEGEIVINGRTLVEHFGNAVNEADLRMPFRVTGTESRYNAMIKVEGGPIEVGETDEVPPPKSGGWRSHYPAHCPSAWCTAAPCGLA